MKPQGLKLDEFIGMPNKIFAIPIFQRNYAWKPEHCKVFLDDILRLATTKNMAGEHYLGTICYKPHFKNNNTIECLIIDGQQRITTSMLLLRAIANHKNIDNKLKELIENNYINDSRDSKLRLKPMAKDENAFKEIMENSISDTTKGTRLFEAYEYFRENLKDTNKEDLMCIFNSLNRIQVIALELEEHDKAEIIFESINATGEKLHNCDLVRNYLMIDKDYDTQKRLFNEYWRHIEDLLGSEEELEQFVGHFLRISYENKITKDNIYAYFKKYKEEKGDSLPALEEMLYYAKIYALFVEKYHILEEYKPKEKKEIQKKIKTIVILKSGISYPFIMQIFNDFLQDNLDFSQLISILDIICSYIIRGQICSNIKNGNKIMYSLYSQMKEYMQQGDYVVALQKCLARDTAYFSNDKDFKECFVEYNFYNNRIRSLAKLILDRKSVV